MTDTPKENGEKPDLSEFKDPVTGKFLPGNPGGPGRPQGSVSIIGRIKKIFEEDPDYFEEYVREVLADPKLKAEIVRQIDGAPKQSLAVQADVTNRDVEITDEQYERIIRERAAKLGGTESVEG